MLNTSELKVEANGPQKEIRTVSRIFCLVVITPVSLIATGKEVYKHLHLIGNTDLTRLCSPDKSDELYCAGQSYGYMK